jgi:hypothetical protein
MRRRPRSQAVPHPTAGARPGTRGRRATRDQGPAWTRFGWTLATAAGLLLTLIGLGIVVSGLPTDPSPAPPSGPLPITFGYALDPDTYLVIQPAEEFHPADPFAYSVNPPVHPGVEQVYVAVVKYQAGQEIVLQPPTPERLLPAPVSFGYQTTTADLIALFGYGWFTMRIYLDPAGPVYAQGRFEVVEPAVPR